MPEAETELPSGTPFYSQTQMVDFGPFILILLLLTVLTPRFTRPTPGPWRFDISPLREIALLVPASLATLWLGQVQKEVPEPYMDEIFHIPQAQQYCQGRFGVWDDKITTPPGLYLIAYALNQLHFLPGVEGSGYCSEFSLRNANVAGILSVGILAVLCRHELEASTRRSRPVPNPVPFSLYSLHTGVNVSLFPLLFFFSGLFYTDVWSTGTVLLALWHCLRRQRQGRLSFLSDVTIIVLGVASLLMRQTNVFWVVIFMGGLEAVEAIKSAKVSLQPGEPPAGTGARLRQWLASCSQGYIHDPPLSMTQPDDVLFCGISLIAAALFRPWVIVKRIWPHLAVLMLFAVFIVWNGGVVLGDKSNHIATIHLAQLLYLWPFIAFCSAPLFISRLVWIGKSLFGSERSDSSRQQAKSDSSMMASNRADPWKRASHAALILVFGVLSVLVVKYNTIIHPFTLADNRHYMFYVFRYTIRRSNAIRYMLVPAYMASCWLVVDTLSEENRSTSGHNAEGKSFVKDSSQFYLHSLSKTATRPIKAGSQPSASDTRQAYFVAYLDDDDGAQQSVPVSTALLLLVSSALSLMTAPLVEPRYFILPWVVWRLLVPGWQASKARPGDANRDSTLAQGSLGPLTALSRKHDIRLFLETAWFLLINLVTGYIFLKWPYQWKAPDGAVLDGGRLQRFMW